MSESFLSATARFAADAAALTDATATLNIDNTDADDTDRPWSLVVVGVTGDGKSTTCNTLCGSDLFETSDSLSSETSECAHADYLLLSDDGPVECRVVDTIGMQDTSLPADEVMRRFSLFSDLVPQGIDIFLFVLKFGRFKPEHQSALDAFVANCGESSLANTLLVFTGCALSPEELAQQLEDKAPPSLKALVPKLAGPPVGVDNIAAKGLARKRLHGAIGAAIAARAQRGGRPYSNAALAEARSRYDVRREEERAAFAAAVNDWRKGSGPVEIVREGDRSIYC